MPEPSTRRRDGAAQAEVERAHALQQQHVRGSAAGRQAKVQHGPVFCMRSVL